MPHPPWTRRSWRIAAAVFALAVLGGGTPVRAAPGAMYTLGGSISGLNAPGLVLAFGGQALNIAPGSTTFTFPQPLLDGSPYAVVVSDSPAGLDCNITANGFGTVAGANVTSVAVVCTGASTGNTVLYAFGTGPTRPDGSSPRSNLIRARDGNFYGTTFSGGAKGLGTVFRLTPAGAESVLHSFGGRVLGDGANPTAALIQASDGNLYGATLIGGPNNTGTIFRISLTGEYAVLHAFERTATGGSLGGISHLVEARDGNFYAATILGGPNGSGTILRISRTGTTQIVDTFGPLHSSDGAAPQGALMQAQDGYLYGTTVIGGTSNTGTVYRFDPASGTHKVIHSFGPTGSGDGNGPYSALLEAPNGVFYGTTGAGGASDQGTVFRVLTGANTGTAESVLYSFQGLGSGDGRVPASDLVLARDGNLYGTTGLGGASGVGVLFRVNTGGTESIVHSFGGLIPGDGAVPVSAPVEGKDGALYGTTSNGGPLGLGTVYRIVP